MLHGQHLRVIDQGAGSPDAEHPGPDAFRPLGIFQGPGAATVFPDGIRLAHHAAHVGFANHPSAFQTELLDGIADAVAAKQGQNGKQSAEMTGVATQAGEDGFTHR
jgi:hypothetical protein